MFIAPLARKSATYVVAALQEVLDTKLIDVTTLMLDSSQEHKSKMMRRFAADNDMHLKYATGEQKSIFRLISFLYQLCVF